MQCLRHAGIDAPLERVSEFRVGPDHYGVRFGDKNLLITLDGEGATENGIECVAGPDGWVLSYDVEEYGGDSDRPPATRRGWCEDCIAEADDIGPLGDEHSAVVLRHGDVKVERI